MSSTVALILSALPTLLKIIEQFVVWANQKELMDRGRREALADAAQSLNKALAKASAAAQEADERHAKDPTDGAFDDEFRRR